MDYSSIGFEKSEEVTKELKKSFLNLITEDSKIDSSKAVLDIGCGTGIIARTIYECTGAKIVALDSNLNLINKAKEMSYSRGMDIEFINMDFEHVKFKRRSFDYVILDFLYEKFEDATFQVMTSDEMLRITDELTKTIKRMRKICKKGGYVYILRPFYVPNFEYMPGRFDYPADLIMKFNMSGRLFGIGASFSDILTSCGLKDVEVLTWDFRERPFFDLTDEMAEEKVELMKIEYRRLKKIMPKIQNFDRSEKKKILRYHMEKLRMYADFPSIAKKDHSVVSSPLFIIKGRV